MTRQRGATWLIRCASPSNLISLQKNLRRENISLSYLWNNICRRPRKRCESGAQHSPPQSKKRSIELNSDPSTASTCWSSELRGAVPTFGKTDAPPSSPPQGLNLLRRNAFQSHPLAATLSTLGPSTTTCINRYPTTGHGWTNLECPNPRVADDECDSRWTPPKVKGLDHPERGTNASGCRD